MRKFWAIIFVALMAAWVLSLGGCGGSDSSDLNTTTITEPDKTTDPKDGGGDDNTDLTDAIEIVLNVNTATVNGTALTMNDYVWHADPDHADEYWTEGINGTKEYDEDEYDDLVDSSKVSGVYIARDVRYMTKDIEFTSTATKDTDTEYVAYYSAAVSAEVAADTGFTGPFIFATLPQSGGGMGGPGGEGGFGGGFSGAVSNSDVDLFETMTHSSADAYANPVLHITEAGTYVLSGTWHGQIWVEVGKKVDHKVTLILNGVEVSCDVAPALVFKKVYECGHADTFADLDDADDDDGIAAEIKAMMASDSSDVSAYVLENAGAVVTISDGTTNTFTGANVYRILKPAPKNDDVTKIDGTDISDQKKLYKMDGAFYSHKSIVIGGGEKGTGKLNITSTTYEGLDSEMHMNIEGGVITVTAEDDGINVNEDNISVFTMNGGSLTVKAPNADGIDSNGYIVITSADVLSITAKDASKPENKANLNSGADGALDADCGVYMSDEVFEIYTANSDGTDAHGGDGAPRDGGPRDGEGDPGGLGGN